MGWDYNYNNPRKDGSSWKSSSLSTKTSIPPTTSSSKLWTISSRWGGEVLDEEFCIADKGFKAEGKKTENGGCSVEFVIPEWVTTEVNQVIIKHLDAVTSAVNAVKSACEFVGYVAKDIKKDLREVFEKHLLKWSNWSTKKKDRTWQSASFFFCIFWSITLLVTK